MTVEWRVGSRSERHLSSGQILAQVSFGKAHALDAADPRLVQVGLPPLDDDPPVERWLTTRPVETGRHGEIAFAADGCHLFGHLLLDEPADGDLETLGRHAYAAVFDCLKAFGRPHLVRVWNYLSRINDEQDGLERYRAFCVGRHRAIAANELTPGRLPAACALGTEAKGLMVSFLAATTPGVQVENPRQMSAFCYPQRYGPKSPSFSRATRYAQDDGTEILFISGTASIVGHESLHPGSITGQLEESCRNIDAVIGAGGDGFGLTAARIYLRHAASWPVVRAACRARLGAALPLIGLTSSICRRELLVEIDGCAVRRHRARPG